MRRTGKAAAFAVLLLLLLGSTIEAQHPRCRTRGCRPSATPSTGSLTYIGSLEQRNLSMYGSFWHLVTVDSGGAGDYTDISEALAYVATQTPTAASRWTVLLYPGNTGFTAGGFSYEEASLTVPDYTAIVGISDVWTGSITFPGQAVVKLTGTAGDLVTWGVGSSASNVSFYISANPTAAVTVMHRSAAGEYTAFRNVAVHYSGSDAFAVTLVKVSGSGGVFAESLNTQRAGAATLSRNYLVSGGALILQDALTISGTGQSIGMEVTGGTVRVLGGRMSGGATTDVTRSGGTLSIDGLAYNTESGTITRAGVLTPRHTHGTAIPATCAVPETFTDTTAGAVRECVCSASNTWVCNARAQSSATAPYTCDAGHAGAVYVDTTSPSLCFCSGSAWTTTVAAGDCT